MTHTPDNTIVWFEIPVSDMTKAMAFYNAVFDSDLTLDTTGPNPMAMFPMKGGMTGPGVSGHLYPGKPAKPGTGPTVHLLVPDTLEATMKRCDKAGGKVMPAIIPLPVGRFAYATDPDGNSIGMFQPS